MRKSSMGEAEAVPTSCIMPVALVAWSKEVPGVDLPDLRRRYQNLGGAHAQVLSSLCERIERGDPAGRGRLFLAEPVELYHLSAGRPGPIGRPVADRRLGQGRGFRAWRL
jgi:hypothetical protein